MEYAWYLAVNGTALAREHDDLLQDVRTADAGTDEAALRLALIGGLVQLGWAKARGATADDEKTRQRELAGLAWWTAEVRRSLEMWSP